MTVPFFPLSWTDELKKITGYDSKYLTLEEVMIFILLNKFKVIDSCIMIDLWLEGDDPFDEY